MPGPLREGDKIVMKGPSAALERISQDLDTRPLQEPPTRALHTSTYKTWHLQDWHAGTSWTGSCQDLYKIFCEEPVQDDAEHSRSYTGLLGRI